jgi:hypothetical protein
VCARSGAWVSPCRWSRSARPGPASRLRDSAPRPCCRPFARSTAAAGEQQAGVVHQAGPAVNTSGDVSQFPAWGCDDGF